MKIIAQMQGNCLSKCKFAQIKNFQLFAASSPCGVINTELPSLSIWGNENVPPLIETGHELPQAGAR